VNLIVGKNNAGKTSVLEAIRLLASGGDPTTLYQIAIERGETLLAEVDTGDYRREVSADISHFFHGHEFGPGSRFVIESGNGLGSLDAEILVAAQLPDAEMVFL
jgi:AAA15 family ATPase/GTPase